MNTETESKLQRVALVTGGSRGIGYAVCKQLSDAGYAIVAAARTEDELKALEAEFQKQGRVIACHGLDISKADAVAALFKAINEEFGRLDVVVNSAGISYVAPVALANLERCNDVLQVNLMGAFMISKEAVRMMTRQRHGRIVLIGSISGTIGASYNAIYAASKAGVAGLVKSLALEVAPLGITVNAVQPGTVHTELFEQTHGARAKIKGITLDEQKAMLEQDNPQKRLVTVHDIAAAVSYLVSDGAASVNGHLLTVDGGRSIA
ncbi:MAG: SDR family NAD(P)-dependent oxidoreductase [Granulosicoccus sp.]